MPLTARCPHCGTHFKLVADQLRVRNGLVRCGVCKEVFDGYDAIVEGMPPPRPPRPAPAAPPPGSPPPGPQSVPGIPPATPTAPHPSPFASSGRPDVEAAPVIAPSRPPAMSPPAPPPAPPPRFAPPAPPTPAASPAPPAVRPALPPARAHDDDVSLSELYRQSPDDDPADPPGMRSLSSRAPMPPGPPPAAVIRTPRPAPPAAVISPRPAPPPRGPAPPSSPPAVLRGRGAGNRIEPMFSAAPAPAHEGDDEPTIGGASDLGPAPGRDDDSPGPGRTRSENHSDDHSAHYSGNYSDDHSGNYSANHSGSSARDAERGYGLDDESDEDDSRFHIPVRGDLRTRYDPSVDAGMAPPEFMDEQYERRSRLWRRLWIILCLLGLVLLGLQRLYVYRGTVVASMPGMRPAYDVVCGVIGCEVGYPRRIERIAITGSSLQPQPGSAAADDSRMRLVLRVTLRNRYDRPQPWPALMLQLTDVSDTVVVRKVLLPEQYLPPGTTGPMGANAEASITVPVQVVGLQVNGYQLDKFFP